MGMPFGLISYMNFDNFNCPKCENDKDIHVGSESCSKREHVCHLCGARFKLSPARIDHGYIVMSPSFVGFECKNCGELLGPAATGTDYCPKCRKDERWGLEQQIKNQKEQLALFEARLAKLGDEPQGQSNLDTGSGEHRTPEESEK